MDENEIEVVEDDSTPDRRTLVIALAAVGLLALTVVIVRATRKAANLPLNAQDAMAAGDWRSSIEHLAAAFNQRCMGIEEQLDDIRAALGQPTPSSAPPPAATSMPEDDGTAGPILRVPPDPSIIGATEPPPPAPASVSM